MIKYECCRESQIDICVEFVKSIDKEFPVKLSDLVNIREYINKLITLGNVFIAKDSDKIVGICAGYINDIRTYNAYVSLLAVKHEYRKNGIASELMDIFVKESNKQNMKRIYLETHKENFRAIKFYKKNKFELLKDAKANTKDSVILMRIL